MRRLINSSCSTIGATLLALALCGQTHANADVYQRALHSTVWILAPDGANVSIGTGVLVDKERRLVVTNQHVVGKSATAQVFFPRYRAGLAVADPKEYLKLAKTEAIPADVLIHSAVNDLALLVLPRLPDGAEAISLAAASPTPGEAVHAIGNSGFGDGVLWRYSTGFVRQDYVMEEKGGTFRARVVETQIPVNHGDSGGPMVNDRGQLVAVTRYFEDRSNLVSGGVDVNEIKELLKARFEVETMPTPEPSLAGRWKTTVKESGKSFDVVLTLGENGTYVLRVTQQGEASEVTGQYTYKDSVLSLIPDDEDAVRGQVKLTGDSEFSWSLNDHVVRNFRRQK